MTHRYSRALRYAATAHEGQLRKDTAIPYITHPVEVSALVARFGGDEDQQIAALLHDVIEDAGEKHAWSIGALFGDRVLRMVRGCTDGMPDESGKKQPWRVRKELYLDHLPQEQADTLLVCGCDKLSNARAICEDLETMGVAVFERFAGKQDGTLWYYRALAKVFSQQDLAVSPALVATVARMEALAARCPPAPHP